MLTLHNILFLLHTILYQKNVLHVWTLFTTERTVSPAIQMRVHSECTLAVKWFSSCLILLSSAPQRALSPRVPASVCLCLEASNNCSSPPPSLFVSYRGSAPSVLPVPLCLEAVGSNGLNVMWLQRCRLQSQVQSRTCYGYWKRTVVTDYSIKAAVVSRLGKRPFEQDDVWNQWTVAHDWSRLLLPQVFSGPHSPH